MQITLNGYSKDIKNAQRLDSVIHSVSRSPKRVIAEVNGELVKAALWSQTTLQEGDAVELVTLVGGG